MPQLSNSQILAIINNNKTYIRWIWKHYSVGKDTHNSITKNLFARHIIYLIKSGHEKFALPA